MRDPSSVFYYFQYETILVDFPLKIHITEPGIKIATLRTNFVHSASYILESPFKVINKYTTVMLTVFFNLFIIHNVTYFLLLLLKEEKNVNLTEFFKETHKTKTSPINVSVRTKIFSFWHRRR